jgi:galactose mutarotase-like enzyme
MSGAKSREATDMQVLKSPLNRWTVIAVLLLTFGSPSIVRGQQTSAGSKTASQEQPFEIGGESVVVLRRPRSRGRSKPQFLEATVLPGRGMAVLQIKAYIPGKGETNLLTSPPLSEAEQILDKGDDQFGNQVFKFGGAILVPFANRIRGNVSPDGKIITATVAEKTVTLPANWSGNNPGAEKHAIHGLMLNSKFVSVFSDNGPQKSTVTASLHAGNFGGHWFSSSYVRVEVTLENDKFDLLVTVRNDGRAPLPMGIGWHPYFVLPGGDRQQVRLRLPSETRAVMNNYDDSFVTGERVSVKDTPYDFGSPDGRPLGTQYLDDNFSDLVRGPDGSTVSEIIDPAAKYGLQLTTLSPSIKSIQVYAPPNKNFVAIEPQFNLPDPYNKDWGDTDTGMVLLQPGQAIYWHVRLGLFTPGK